GRSHWWSASLCHDKSACDGEETTVNRKAIAAMFLAVSGTLASCGSSTNNTTSSSGGGGGPSASSVKVCILSEFRTRPDGLPGLVKTYNSAFNKATYVDIGNT